MEFKILTSSSASGLNDKIKEHLSDGWEVVGGHSVVETMREHIYNNTKVIVKCEYSISIKKPA